MKSQILDTNSGDDMPRLGARSNLKTLVDRKGMNTAGDDSPKAPSFAATASTWKNRGSQSPRSRRSHAEVEPHTDRTPYAYRRRRPPRRSRLSHRFSFRSPIHQSGPISIQSCSTSRCSTVGSRPTAGRIHASVAGIVVEPSLVMVSTSSARVGASSRRIASAITSRNAPRNAAATSLASIDPST